MDPVYQYAAVCDRIIDGDTIVANVDLGFRVHALLPIRIRGMNAPELATPEGKTASAYLLEAIGAVRSSLTPVDLIVVSHRWQQSFARWVANVYVAGTGVDIADVMIGAGHAVPEGDR